MGMPLLLFVVILLAVLLNFRFSIAHYLIPFSQKLHTQCLSFVPQNSHSTQELSALVCGQNFLTAETSYFYSSTGLIHLFVVSGAHLVLLDSLLKKLRIKSFWLRIFILAIYCGCCELNPPVVRSWFVLFLSAAASSTLLEKLQLKNFLSKKNGHNFKSHFLFFVGLICLCFNPLWIFSLSFQLSWLIALAILVNQQIFSKNHLLLHQCSYYLVVLPSISTLQNYSPYSVILNLIFAPVLELVLFPLGLMTLLIHPLYHIFDFLIQILKDILMTFELQTNPSVFVPNQSIYLINWSLILLLHLILHLHQISKLRSDYV